MHFSTHPLCSHNSTLPQYCKMLADLGLPLTCALDQVFDRSWSLSKQREEFQPRRISQHLAQFSLQLIELLFSIHLLPPLYILTFDYVNIITLLQKFVKAVPLLTRRACVARMRWLLHH